MKKVFPMLIVAFIATSLGLNAQETTKAPPARPGTTTTVTKAKAATPAPAARGDDEKAIKALLETFTKAFNAGDAEAAAATYS